MSNPSSKEVVVIDRREREIIPCPDGREDCEVLHLAPLSEDEPPERISINPAVAARYPVTDKRVGDIEYTRTSTDSAGAMVDHKRIAMEIGRYIVLGGLSETAVSDVAAELERLITAPKSNLEPHTYQEHPLYPNYCAFAVGNEDYCKREPDNAIHQIAAPAPLVSDCDPDG